MHPGGGPIPLAKPGAAQIRAPPHHAVLCSRFSPARRRTRRIDPPGAGVGLGPIPVGTPFPHIPPQAVESPAVRRESSNWARSPLAVLPLIDDRELTLPEIHPPDAVRVLRGLPLGAEFTPQSGGVFPLRLRWQPFPDPLAIRDGIGVTDLHHGVLFATSQVAVRSLGMTPVRPGDKSPAQVTRGRPPGLPRLARADRGSGPWKETE